MDSMLRDPLRFLDERERSLLLAITEATLPAGRVLAAGDSRTVTQAERLLASVPASMQSGYRGLLVALDAWCLATHRKRFIRLDTAERREVMAHWQRSHTAKRLGLRALLAPIKLAHFDSPALYRHLGGAYERPLPQAEARPRYMNERVHSPDEFDEDLSLECDVVVIGTGAGGAVVAKELAELGHAVVMVEEGGYFERRDFIGRPVDMQRKLYRDSGATFAVGNAWIPIPVGRSVGGTTTVNSGTCYRVPGRVLKKWREDMGLSEFTEANMEPYFARVEEILQVEPAPARYLGGVADVIARGCDKLGYRHAPLQRNAPGCDGQGVCCFGCPTDAKRSTNVSYVPLALRAGAEIFTGARVTRVMTRNGRAAGVMAEVAAGGEGGSRKHTLTVHAAAVVVACGSLLTPVLLSDNRLCQSSGQLGRNLSIHPAAALAGVFDQHIGGYSAIPQGYAIEEFQDQGLLFEGSSAPPEMALAASPLFGPRLIELAEAFDRVALFGFMIEDESRGRVRSVNGKPFITYMLGDGDVARLLRGVEMLTRVMFAAGAERVHLPLYGLETLHSVADLAELRRRQVRARDFDLSAYHPLGTARMGVDAKSSVVGPDHQCHDVPGLYITDGASVPSSLAVNPQITIMAMATRAAERIDAALPALTAARA